ncbi:2192_t:CDS:2 [Funneliformis geosporum]|uniref:2192_t:CDS:1 n=1 Tax=Funneliformis geosporum TaxID=1117311 RepID=A0A9W4SSU0_9GLOM|nr:2192_t:CDS:2 [Funneliformis geosporum]
MPQLYADKSNVWNQSRFIIIPKWKSAVFNVKNHEESVIQILIANTL